MTAISSERQQQEQQQQQAMPSRRYTFKRKRQPSPTPQPSVSSTIFHDTTSMHIPTTMKTDLCEQEEPQKHKNIHQTTIQLEDIGKNESDTKDKSIALEGGSQMISPPIASPRHKKIIQPKMSPSKLSSIDEYQVLVSVLNLNLPPNLIKNICLMFDY